MLHYSCLKNSDPNVSWLTFIHGAGGNSSIWHLQVRFFKRFYHLLLVDLRGHGKSAGHNAVEEYTFDNVTEDIVEVLDQENISKKFLSAHPGLWDPFKNPRIAKFKISSLF